MAIKTGASHLFATLLLTLISALLIHFLKHIGLFENAFNYLMKISFRFSHWLENAFAISITYELFPTVFIASLLAFAWGVVYHVARK